MTEKKTVDRPVEEIVAAITRLINDGKISGQLARDLEKLCIEASRAPK